MKEGEAIVELEDITKVYDQGAVEVFALRGLSLSIDKGEFAALCGPSGSGKTTALNLIGALDTPTSGSIRLEGTNLSSLSRRELSRIRRDGIDSSGGPLRSLCAKPAALVRLCARRAW